MICLTVPGIPPSANHYKGYNSRTRRWYVKPEATAFKADVAILLAGRKMPDAPKYRVEIIVYLPKGKRGDAANFEKVTCDALQAAGAIKNDSRARRVEIETRRDWSNPRTEITIEVFDRKGK
jgi:Holliday junction resolvase RusA-like endonuclease